MCNVLVLQKFYGLSDDATAKQIVDRKNFLGLRIGNDILDAKMLWDFKQRIEVDTREDVPEFFAAACACDQDGAKM